MPGPAAAEEEGASDADAGTDPDAAGVASEKSDIGTAQPGVRCAASTAASGVDAALISEAEAADAEEALMLARGLALLVRLRLLLAEAEAALIGTATGAGVASSHSPARAPCDGTCGRSGVCSPAAAGTAGMRNVLTLACTDKA